MAHQAATTANCPRAAQSCSHSLRGTLKRDIIIGQLVAAAGGPTDTQCLLVEAQLPVIIFQNFQHRQTILVTHTALDAGMLAS